MSRWANGRKLGLLGLLLATWGMGPAAHAAAVQFTSRANGFWADANTWTPNPAGDHNFPIMGDTATVNHTVSLAAHQSVSNLYLNNPGQFTLNGYTVMFNGVGGWTGGTVNGGTLDQAGDCTLSGNGAKPLVSATLVNHGTITHDGGGNLTLSLGSALNNQTSGTTAVYRILSDADLVAAGGGAGSAPSIVNSGVIRKEAGAGTTTLGVAVGSNVGGVIECQSGVLEFLGTSVTNTGGTIRAAGGDVHLLNGTVVTEGTLDRTGASAIRGVSGTVTLNDVTNSGEYVVHHGTVTALGGTLCNNYGRILLNHDAACFGTSLRIDGNLLLGGNGDLLLNCLSGGGASLDSSGANVLTNGPAHTIHGMGRITATLDNEGEVNADVTGAAIGMNTNNAANSGQLIASNGGELSIEGIVVTQSPTAEMLGDNGVVALRGGTVVGGLLDTANGGSVRSVSGTNTLTDTHNLGDFIINYGTETKVNGTTLTNDGTVLVNHAAACFGTNLTFDADVMLVGDGDVRLNCASGVGASLNTGTGYTVTQAATHLIHGMGRITAALANAGTVDADVTNETLALNSNNKSNTGVLKASDGGTLYIDGVQIDNTGGDILADGGAVALSNSSIVRGVLNTTGASSISGVGGTNTLTDVSNLGSYVINHGTTTTILGPSLTNAGTVLLNHSAACYGTNLTFGDNVLLSGGGELILNCASGVGASVNTAAGATLTQAANHVTRGMGQITAALANEGLVHADLDSATLTLNGQNKTNDGTLKASNNGNLVIDGVTITQGGAGLVVADGANVWLNGAAIAGGELQTANGGVIRGNAGTNTLDTVINSGDFAVHHGTTLRLVGSTLLNNGTLLVNHDAACYGTTVTADDNVLLTGNGDMRLNCNSGAGARLASGTGFSVTNDTTHLIHGMGQISAALVNHGVVNADVTNESLLLHNLNKINHATLKASNGAALDIAGTTVTQSATGEVFADNGTVRLNSAVIDGGTLRSAGTGVVYNVAGTSTLHEVTNLGEYAVQHSTGTSVTGSQLVNQGHILLNHSATCYGTPLTFNDDVLLTGTGTLQLNCSTGGGATVDTGPGKTLTNDAGHTIYGMGRITASMVNDGVVRADVANERILLEGNTKTNHNDLMATNQAYLDINNIRVEQGGAGEILADGGTVRLDAAVIAGGVLDTANGGTVRSTGGTVTLENVTNLGSFLQHHSTGVLVKGSGLVNEGTFLLNHSATCYGTSLAFDGTSVLSGSGRVTLNCSSGAGASLDTTANSSVNQAAGHTIDGFGRITANMINYGTVEANAAEAINIEPASDANFSNAGLLHVTGPGGMVINNPARFNNAGQVVIDATRGLRSNGSYRQSAGSTRVEGELWVPSGVVDLQGGVLMGTGLVRGNIDNDFGIVAPGSSAGTLNVQGLYTQSTGGTLRVELGGPNPADSDLLAVTGAAKLCGGELDIRLINGFVPSVGQSFVVLTAASVDGDFSRVSGRCIGPGVLLNVTVGANNVTLTAAAGVCANAIASSNPPQLAIDARQDVSLNGATRYGWDTVDLTFNGSAAGAVPADFALVSTSGTPPTVSQVTVNGNVATVKLSGPIPVGAWTTIKHNASLSTVTLGYLPGDTNSDGTANARDIISLINHLNRVHHPPMQLWQCDLNRSGACNAQDISREIDILNGAGALVPWVNIAVPSCVLP
ncbi:MAG: hypothetical protein HY763_06900 [Planctomycetes bacterium]|nr:hypothetical protein [Planctomycetota bacterium]